MTHLILGNLSPSSVNFALLVARIVLAGVFLAHGINHIIGGGKIAGTARWFESLGMRPGILHAWMASLTEVGAGVLLVLGLLTPVAGAGVVGVMLVAWITNHLKNGFFIFRPGEGWEYVMDLRPWWVSWSGRSGPASGASTATSRPAPTCGAGPASASPSARRARRRAGCWPCYWRPEKKPASATG